MTGQRPTPGSCAGELTGALTNGCGDRISCSFCVLDRGTFRDCADRDIGPGGTISVGLLACGVSSSGNWTFRCSLSTDPISCRHVP